MADYYKVLGVAKSASDQEIKSAFRKLALQFHPDRNKDNPKAEDKFKEINEAYAVLSDAEKRKQYDTFGDSNFHQKYSREDIFRGTDFQSIFDEFDLGNVNNIFSHIFGGGRSGGFGGDFRGGGPFGAGMGGRRGAHAGMKGQDVEYPLTIDFMESYRGSERQIRFRLQDGTSQELNIKIPAGVRNGGKLRVAGKGAASPYGGQPGDLFIVLKVNDHPEFVREGNDINVQVKIKPSELLLGCSREINSPDGLKRIKIPECSSPNMKLRLRGLGFPDPGHPSQRGDLFAAIVLDVPKKLNKKQKALVESLMEAEL